MEFHQIKIYNLWKNIFANPMILETLQIQWFWKPGSWTLTRVFALKGMDLSNLQEISQVLVFGLDLVFHSIRY